ncbi:MULTISPECIES: signal recognition particle-docking protein FtsY [unclassified Modicisalibacter]|uniref:signal recognition particle-docking protein FtsY n=1 Tax=unclassified Modicisalibacter TaxID=2679913 RepID=UPI001CCC3324|nr:MULTISPECIES: signal recognition particle-docking protein FtsY [unclassified Modicisalibacter]MBZ9558180.1 signal recognition particle-docking protein FtsY [Modicisalibacter sp. R2A 31.J]MBZ9573151.1 signal recognition particle-docking protein FtsY [Modicisalibacter sp. MOD 31.J]
MFGFFKRKKTQQDPAARDDAREASVDETEVEEAAERGESDAAEAPVHEVDPQREPAAAYSPDTLEQTAAREALDGDVATGEARSALDETPAVAPGESLAEPAAPSADERRAEAAHEPADSLGDPAAPDDAEAPGRETETVESVEVSEPAQANDDDAPEADHATAGRDKPRGEKKGWLARIRAGLGKTRANLTEGLADLFLGKKQIDDDLMEDLETQLLMADVGIEATTEIIDNLTERVSRKELKDPQALFQALQEELTTLLAPVTTPLALPPKGEGPFVILMVGVNGVGKTTTIGKLTQRFQNEGRSVMLAAGDTFRAAAVEQLKVWGERNRVPVIAQHTGADSASVIYDALAAAKARGVDVLIADTAGRLHNKSHLMEELKKVQRVMAKLDAQAPHEVMLVLDAGTGQNALSQAQTFNEAIPVTGITLTKLDGTAKGGIIFALAKQLATPIRFIGVGETLDDLRPFAAEDFVTALFDRDASAES